MLKIREIMTKNVKACSPEDTLNDASRIMWENDCGAVPVIDAESKVVGMITDRDVCMTAYVRDAPLGGIRVADAMSRNVLACNGVDTVDIAENMMQLRQVRRLPVIDYEGRLVGIVSLNDLARRMDPNGVRSDGPTCKDVAATLAAVSEPPRPRRSSVPARPQSAHERSASDNRGMVEQTKG